MKTILLFSILFCVIAMPAMGELTDADLDKIRLIIREEIKSEINAVKVELKQDTAKTEEHLKETFSQKIETVNTKIDSTDRQISSTRSWAIGLLALIAIAIGTPYAYALWMSRRYASQEVAIDRLLQQIQMLENRFTDSLKELSLNDLKESE